MKLVKKISKITEYSYIKVVQKFKEKKYKSNGIVLKYMYEDNDSDELVIVFSACTRKGIKARYNYVRTLKNVKKNKLFILDNFGIDHRGAYYLGEYPEFFIEKAVSNLINSFILKYNFTNVYFVGSSKGGYAALNFGLLFKNSKIIVGAPQYLLGNYLCEPALQPTLKSITKTDVINKEVKNNLNNIIKNKIQNNNNNCKVYIHYSINDHTFNEHIRYLLNDLQKNNIKFVENIEDYSNHGDVSLYFPKYLVDSINVGSDIGD